MRFYKEAYINRVGKLEYVRKCRSESEMPESKAELYMPGHSKGKTTGGTFKYTEITEAAFYKMTDFFKLHKQVS